MQEYANVLQILFAGVNDGPDKMESERSTVAIDRSQNVDGNILIQTGDGRQEIKQV